MENHSRKVLFRALATSCLRILDCDSPVPGSWATLKPGLWLQFPSQAWIVEDRLNLSPACLSAVISTCELGSLEQ